MPFSEHDREAILVACGRHCCICHKFCGTKIELHHIVLESEGGDNSLDNCVPVCFDCHADMRSYDHKHPKGTKYSRSEVRKHRDNWFEKIRTHNGRPISDNSNAQDAATYKQLIQDLEYQTVMQFMHFHDFATSFDSSNLVPFSRFVRKWESPSLEFLDTDLEGMRCELRQKMEGLLEQIALTTFQIGQSKWFGVPSDWEISHPKKYCETVTQLNNLSRGVYECYASLIREARRRLEL